MKQKVVIRVSMTDAKTRKKALKTVVGCLGVESTALTGNDKNQIEVIGEGIDPVKITTLLRKNVGYSDILSVNSVDEKKEKKDDDTKEDNSKPAEPAYVIYSGSAPYQIIYRDSNPDPCSIL